MGGGTTDDSEDAGGGTVLVTVDGGAHWRAQKPGVVAHLYSVAFEDASHGLAVGYGGTILSTTDGGAHWVVQRSGTDKGLYSVTFSDATHVWTVGDRGTILAQGGPAPASTASLWIIAIVPIALAAGGLGELVSVRRRRKLEEHVVADRPTEVASGGRAQGK